MRDKNDTRELKELYEKATRMSLQSFFFQGTLIPINRASYLIEHPRAKS